MSEPTPSNKVNPESSILQQVDGEWQKMCAFILWKTVGRGVVKIDIEDMKRPAVEFHPGFPVIFTHGHADAIEFSLVTEERAKVLAEYDAAQNKGGRA